MKQTCLQILKLKLKPTILNLKIGLALHQRHHQQHLQNRRDKSNAVDANVEEEVSIYMHLLEI